MMLLAVSAVTPEDVVISVAIMIEVFVIAYYLGKVPEGERIKSIIMVSSFVTVVVGVIMALAYREEITEFIRNLKR